MRSLAWQTMATKRAPLRFASLRIAAVSVGRMNGCICWKFSSGGVVEGVWLA
jgi:hypothetical protein